MSKLREQFEALHAWHSADKTVDVVHPNTTFAEIAEDALDLLDEMAPEYQRMANWLRRVQGRIDIPDPQSIAVLLQDADRIRAKYEGKP